MAAGQNIEIASSFKDFQLKVLSGRFLAPCPIPKMTIHSLQDMKIQELCPITFFKPKITMIFYLINIFNIVTISHLKSPFSHTFPHTDRTILKCLRFLYCTSFFQLQILMQDSTNKVFVDTGSHRTLERLEVLKSSACRCA